MVADGCAGARRRVHRGGQGDLCDNSAAGRRPSTIVYGVGWTHHSGRRADHPHGGHPAAAAGEHRPAWRRDHGDARPQQHPGQHRHPNAVRPCCPATCRSRRADKLPRNDRQILQVRRAAHRVLGQYQEVHRQPDESLLRPGGHEGERLCHSSGFPRIDGDYSHLLFFNRMAGGQSEGLLRLRSKPGRRRTERGTAPPRRFGSSTGWWSPTGSSTETANVLEGRPQKGPPPSRTSKQKCSSSPPPASPPRKARSPTPSG